MKILRWWLLLPAFLMLPLPAIDLPYHTPALLYIRAAPVDFVPLVAGQPLIPARYLAEWLGMEVEVNNHYVTFQKEGLVIRPPFQGNEAVVNGEAWKLPDDTVIWRHRMYFTPRTVPVLFEGVRVTYDEQTRQITLITAEKTVHLTANTQFLFPTPELIQRLHGAAAAGNAKELGELLSANPAITDVPDLFGYTALHRAAEAGQLVTTDILLRTISLTRIAADPNVKAVDGATPLTLAVQSGNRELVALLIENSAKVSARGVGGATPLHIAAWTGQVEIMRLLLDHGAWVNAPDYANENTPLHLAVAMGQIESANLLLSRGARSAINRKNQSNQTPLLLCANSRQCTLEMLHLLLKNGADPNARDNTGYDVAGHVRSRNEFIVTNPSPGDAPIIAMDRLLVLLRKYGYRG